MSQDEVNLGSEFHRTRRGDHEDTIFDLSTSFTGELPTPATLERVVDSADGAYAALHNAGKLIGPFELPSVRAARLQREAVAENRPPVLIGYSWRDSDYRQSQQEMRDAVDPNLVLASQPNGTVAILEEVCDNDALAGSKRVTWLICEGVEDARRYIAQVGEYFSEPGPGEDDGRYTFRSIYIKQPSQPQ